MIFLNDLSIQYGNQVLFEGVSLQFDPYKRYGLVGANGSGKSTLLKVLSGVESNYSGTFSIPKNLSVGTMNQDHYRFEKEKIIDVVISGNKRLWKAMQEKEKLLAKDEHSDAAGTKIAELEEIIASEDGYSAEAKAYKLLNGLGIGNTSHPENMSALSGGYKLRVLLAQVLFGDPDILFLDEPTNHLDIVSIHWLEEYLSYTFGGMLLVVSHDRNFLNKVCTHTVDLDYKTITVYTGDYNKFLQAKELAEEQTRKENVAVQRKIDEMEVFIDRFKAKATKARQAQSRMKQVEKMKAPELKVSTRRFPLFKFEKEKPSGKTPLKVNGIAKSFGENKVLHNISFHLMKGDKVALIGPNGIGKSTLLKIICSELEADAGKIEEGHEFRFSYFAQNHHDNLQGNNSVYDWLYSCHPGATIGQIRGTLAKVLFSEEDVKKPVKALSGGESARLNLARIMMEKANVLILDEPSNHLDMESISALEKALQAFDGSIIFVSHDKLFVSSIATRVLELKPEGLNDYPGSYKEYLDRFGEDYLDRLTKTKKGIKLVKPEIFSNSKKKTQPELSYDEKKQIKRLISQTKSKIKTQETQIEENEKELALVNEKLSEPTFYEKNGHDTIRAVNTKKTVIEKKLQEIMKAWEKLSLKLEKEEAKISD